MMSEMASVTFTHSWKRGAKSAEGNICQLSRGDRHKALHLRLDPSSMMVSLCVLAATAATFSEPASAALALRGGASMPQTVLAATGSVISLSGVATLLE